MLKLLAGMFARRARDAAGQADSKSEPPAVTLPSDPMTAGKLLMERGDAQSALQAFEQALASHPDSAAAWCNRGSALAALGLPAEAADCFSRSLALDPALEAGYNNLCLALSEVGRFEEATTWAERGVARFPQSLPLQLAAATVLHRAVDLESARSRYEAIVSEHPENADARVGLSLVLRDMGDLAAAERQLHKVLDTQPRHANATLCLAFLELMQGQFASGWRDYEARLATPEAPLTVPKLPLWKGESLAGTRLLVVGEQGLGDQIMFSSCLPDLAGRVSRIEVWADPKLVTLLQQSFPFAHVDAPKAVSGKLWAQAAQFDFQIPMGSLPRLLRNSAESYPKHSGFLRADPHARAAWRDRLGSIAPGPRVGISWRGGLFKTRRSLRSIPAADFARLLEVPDIHFVNLQHDATPEEVAELSAHAPGLFHSFPDHMNDYADLAALIMNLDLVIGVQGSIVHLSGGLGRPTWALLPACPEWRYGASGENMPWYPAVRLVRQKRLGEWRTMLEALRLELTPTLQRNTGSKDAGSPLAPQSDDPLTHANLAQTQLKARDFTAAARTAETALALDHTCSVAHVVMGRISLERGDTEEALDCFRLALHFDPSCAAAHSGCGAAFNARGDYPRAIRHFEEALALDPNLGEACCGLAVALDKEGRPQEATPHYQTALAADPSDVIARSNLGLILRTEGRYDEALALLEPVAKLAPDKMGALCNLALVRQDMGQLDAAVELFDRALKITPNDAELHVNRALTRLLQGNFGQGWPEYEWRARLPSMLPRPFGFRPWRGEAAPPMRILVYGEQGLGDEIMFASCLPDLLAMEHRLVVECDPRLAPLFSRSFPTVLVHGRLRSDDTTWLPTAGHIDRQIAIGSLPGFFRRSAADFPKHNGYLKADAASVEQWRARLAELGPGLKVGLSWRGGAARTRSHLRSVELPRLIPLLSIPGVSFVSVQYGSTADALAALRQQTGAQIHEFANALSDYDQTAALCCALDLVISVQTAVVHLCGALGRPVWAMIPFAPEWRYMRDGDRLPWYPTARLFRQPNPGDWETVISQAASALEDFASTRGAWAP